MASPGTRSTPSPVSDRSDRPGVLLVSDYPPAHSGIGRYSFDLVQELRTLRPVEVLANRTGAPRLDDPSVHPVWTRAKPGYPFAIAGSAPPADRRAGRIAHVMHHFFLYGGPLSVATFPVLLLLLRIRGYRVVAHFHSVIDPGAMSGTDRVAYSALSPGLVRWGLARFYRTVAVLSDAVAVCTSSMERLLVRTYRLPADRVWIVPAGWTNPSVSTGAPAPGDDRRSRVILFHGFLDPTKGLEELIDAFAEIARSDPSVTLVLAGELSPEIGPGGPGYLRSLRRQVVDLDLDARVRFTGYLSEDELARTVAGATVVVLPYTMQFSHGGSSVLSRVGGFGRPLVASAISRFADELVDGDSALLVPPGDRASLVAAIRRLLADPALAGKLGDGLRRLAGSRSWASVASRLDQQLYPRLLPTGPR